MFEPIAAGDFSPTLLNVLLLALSAMLPMLLLAYGRQWLLARRLRPEFSLHRSETAELDRALLLYRQVRGRLAELSERSQKRDRLWAVVFPLQPDLDQGDADEREDLEAHASHLYEAIVRLRGLPLERLRGFVHVMSLRCALGRALTIGLAAFMLFFLVLRWSEQLASAHAWTLAARYASDSYPLDPSLLQANAIGVCLAALAVPSLYLLRRTALRREYGLEFCVLKELAVMQPGSEMGRVAPEIGAAQPAKPIADDAADLWFTILGVAPTSSIDQVREAYKALIKQNHPDRVHGLSPAIEQFAEAQAKRINAAYQQALAVLT